MQIDKISKQEARALYLNAINAMKCDTTGTVTFEIEKDGSRKLVKAIPLTESYTITDRKEWKDDLFHNDNITYRHTMLILDGKKVEKIDENNKVLDNFNKECEVVQKQSHKDIV